METFVNYTTITYLFPKMIQTHKNLKKLYTLQYSLTSYEKLICTFLHLFLTYNSCKKIIVHIYICFIYKNTTTNIWWKDIKIRVLIFLPSYLPFIRNQSFFFILLAAQHMYLQQFSMTLESNKFQKSPMHKNAQDCTFSSKYCFTIKISRTFEEKMGYFLH